MCVQTLCSKKMFLCVLIKNYPIILLKNENSKKKRTTKKNY